MKRMDIKKFAGTAFSWANYELKNIKRNGNGELIQVTVEASLNTGTNSIDVIYEVDENGNTTWATDSWTMTPVTGTNTVILTKTYASDTSEIKGIQVKSWSNNLEADLYFYFTVVDSNKTTYITKTSATAVLKGNVLNSLNTYDWNNAPSVAAVRNYLDSGSFVHQNDVESIVSQAVSNALLAAHPVGSIEINITGTNPSEYLGGTWEQIKDVFLLAAGDTYVGGTNGGAATVQLTVNQLPKVSGSWSIHAQEGGTEWFGKSGYATGTVYHNYRTLMGQTPSGGATSLQDPGFAFGNNEAHNNMPPYIVVYVWKRIN